MFDPNHFCSADEILTGAQETACRVNPHLSPPLPENVCGESWHLVGNSCLKFITAKDSYDNAKLACRSHNAVLASLTTPKKVDFVLKELQMMSAVVRTNTARLSLGGREITSTRTKPKSKNK